MILDCSTRYLKVQCFFFIRYIFHYRWTCFCKLWIDVRRGVKLEDCYRTTQYFNLVCRKILSFALKIITRHSIYTGIASPLPANFISLKYLFQFVRPKPFQKLPLLTILLCIMIVCVLYWTGKLPYWWWPIKSKKKRPFYIAL